MKKKATKAQNKKLEKKTTDITKVNEIISFLLDENKEEKNSNEDIDESEILNQLNIIQEDTLESDKENEKESKTKKIKLSNDFNNKYLEIKNEEPESNENEEIISDNNKETDKIQYENSLKKESNKKEAEKEGDKSKYDDNNPPKYFLINNSKKIDKKLLFKDEVKNQKFNIYVYSLELLGKKFNRTTKRKDIPHVEYIYYYCINHRTMKESNVLNSKGKIKRISLCNARIIYVKNNDEFYTDWDHSTFCKNEVIIQYENKGEIEEEINNYKNMKKAMIKYLNSHPMISCKEFITKGYKIYHKNNCKFKIERYTFKNIYYNWRKNSLAFTKYSALENSKTNDGDYFLRDYCHITLYNSSGKSLFLHEHMIFISNYFIKKVKLASHIYIDGTFLYPKDFKQLIIILYRNDESGIRYPGLFALINNKKYEGYRYLFQNVKNILTIENTENLNIISYSIDFESSLIKATKEIFQNIRQIGCFYHYCRNIRETAIQKKILKSNNNEKGINFINEYYKLPFVYYKNTNCIIEMKKYFKDEDENYKEFYEYFNNQWKPYFENGMLNYIYLNKEQRSNSYIENYNRRIKLKLSKYLYGKNHCKISWPLFLYFIKKEEEDYRNEIFGNEKELVIKHKKVKKFKRIKILKDGTENKNYQFGEKESNKSEDLQNEEEKINNAKWFKWVNNSCRYDSFSLIYALLIKPKFAKLKITPETYNVEYLNNLFSNICDLSSKDLNKGFWKYLQLNKDNKIDLTTNLMCYGRKGSLYQILDLLRCNNFFCFEYKLEEGCTNTNCIKNHFSLNFLNPYIIFKEDDVINSEKIDNKFYNLMKNELSICNKCGYDSKGNILNSSNPTFYRIIHEKISPKVFFVVFDLLNENDEGTQYELDILEFQRRKQYKDVLYSLLKKEIKLENSLYELKGIILTPQYDHFTSLILNYNSDIFDLKKGFNYFYDGMTIQHDINLVNNLSEVLKDNIIYMGVYIIKN